jgi:hypothetical protein
MSDKPISDLRRRLTRPRCDAAGVLSQRQSDRARSLSRMRSHRGARHVAPYGKEFIHLRRPERGQELWLWNE